MHFFHRFFDDVLCACDLLLETLGTACGLLGQSRKLDIDAHQCLDDFIMQVAADAPAFLLFGLQKVGRERPYLRLPRGQVPDQAGTLRAAQATLGERVQQLLSLRETA